ncbi:sensor histidine kinase [Soonwooa purpurea]
MKFLLGFLLIVQFHFAQTTPYSFNLDRISGLPSQVIYDVFQDKKSFIWFGTEKGICRYDGLQIKHILPKDFAIKAVSHISQDLKGRIWFQDFSGRIYYIQGTEINLFKPFQANGFLKYGIIGNQLFIAGKDEVRVFNLLDLRLTNSIKVDMTGVKHSISDGEKFYLIGSKIQSLDINGKLNAEITPDDYTTKISAPLLVIKDGKLYIFSKFGEYYLGLHPKPIYHKLPFKNIFTQNVIAYNDSFWLASTKGIYRIDVDAKSYQHFFPDSNISSIVKTTTGNYWITSQNKGAYFVKNFDSNLIATASTPISFEKTNNQLYFSTNRDEIFRLKNNHVQPVFKGISDHAINAFKIDSINQKLLISSSKFIIKSQQSQLEHVFAVKAMTQLDKKYYAISASGWNGIIYTDPNLQSAYDKNFVKFPKYQSNGIYFITLMDGENGKSNIFNPQDQSIFFLTNHAIKYFKDGEIKQINSSSKFNFTQLVTAQSTCFLLSENEILYHISPRLQIEKLNFGKKHSNENIKNIRTVDNQLYFTKEGILYRYNFEKNTLTSIINLPPSTDFFDITSLGNRLFLATNKGIIDISKNTKKTSEFLVLDINDVKVNGISNSKLEQLKSNENNIEIFFDIISSMPVSTYKIKYKIDQNPWEILNNSERSLRFSSLSYGKHQIILRIEYEENVVDKNFYLKIDTPFWMTWWAITLGIILLLVLVYLYFQNKIRLLNKKNEEVLAKSNLEKLVNESKLKSLKSQMNPHFYFNALNTLQSYILSNEKSQAVFYLSKFSRLTRNILDMSDNESQSLSDEISMLKDYIDLEKIRFGDDFNYQIHADQSLLSDEVQLPSLITQPFVENAIQHGLMHKSGIKSLKIDFRDADDYFEIQIADNGIGRKRSNELNRIRQNNHKSFATQAINERIAILNQQLKKNISLRYTDHENPTGTTVSIVVPKHLF